MMMMEEKPWPQYELDKKMYALQIRGVTYFKGGGAEISPMDQSYPPFEVGHAFCQKYSPAHPDYFVVFEDGCQCCMTQETFEDVFKPEVA